jgi:hypothetical protein
LWRRPRPKLGCGAKGEGRERVSVRDSSNRMYGTVTESNAALGEPPQHLEFNNGTVHTQNYVDNLESCKWRVFMDGGRESLIRAGSMCYICALIKHYIN